MLAAKERFAPFACSGWVYDLKEDGWRAIVARDGDAVTVWSRAGIDMTALFPRVVEQALSVECTRFVLDGEVCVRDEHGVSRLELLHGRKREAQYVPFDLLAVGSAAAVSEPLHARRACMAALLDGSALKAVQSASGDAGAGFFDRVVRLGFEGVVAKRTDSAYTSGRSAAWRKIKPAVRVMAA